MKPAYKRRLLARLKSARPQAQRLMTEWAAGRISAACLNHLCQLVWEAENPPYYAEKPVDYHQRRRVGTWGMRDVLDDPSRNLDVAVIFRRCGVSLVDVRHLLRTKPDPVLRKLQRQVPAVLPPEARTPWPEETVAEKSVSVWVAASPEPWPLLELDAAHYELIEWPDDATVVRAFRFINPPEYPLETVYLLYRRLPNGWLSQQGLVVGDSALQKQLVLKKDEEYWKNVWHTLDRWRRLPTWEESLAAMNRLPVDVDDEEDERAAA